MEDNNIKWNYCDVMDGIKGDAEEKENAISLYNADTASAKISSVKRGMPKIAVAALAFVCVLVLSGGVVWAMNSAAIKDFFFPNSEEEFKQVYTEVGKEYDIGSYKIIYEGSAYEESVEQGYLSLSVWDKEGNPVSLEELFADLSLSSYKWLPNGLLTDHFIHSYELKIGSDKWYFVSTYNNGLSLFTEDNNLYMTFSRLDTDENGENYYEGKNFQFMILNKDQWKTFNDDIKGLNQSELCPMSYDKETDRVISNYDTNALLPEVVEIINRYDPCDVESLTYSPQVIQIGNVKLTVGRANMLIDYNVDDCDLGDFIVRRADGTELKLSRKETTFKKGNGENGHSVTWYTDNPQNYNTGFGSTDDKTGNSKWGFNYGFILGADEKVTIETNGQIYE